ncbi:phosphomannose isomerase type II C-terminal cupin domain [Tabrizicola sp.]|uniref:phosphomannose isomerase type II C-terminal cupin domain n=1 Tax=Tabrizicola sp. TaxID=2005166 RepID=UPI003F37484F
MDGSRHSGFAEAPAAAFRPAGPAFAAPRPDSLLAEGARFRVRSLRLSPGVAMTQQSHLHRSEHWVVVEGTVRVTLTDRTSLVAEGEAFHIPVGEPHRLENPGRLPALLITVQTGGYLGEDDIIVHNDSPDGI